MAKKFAHLHVHTMFSLLDGMIRPKELARKAVDCGYEAVAITDHGTMYGCVQFWQAMKDAGIKPIIGCEVYVATGSRFDKGDATQKKGKKKGKKKAETDKEKYFHLVLLCKDVTGYKNLCRLVTRSNTEGYYYKPRIDFELLQQYHEGLVCLSACLAGELPRNIVRSVKGETDEERVFFKKQADETVRKYHKLFGDDYYLEIQNHGIPEEKIVAEEIYRISKETGIKLVCTNDCHYLNSEDAKAHDWLMAMQTKKTIDDPDRIRYEGDYSFLPEDEMRALFPSIPEAFDNTSEVAEKCNFDFTFADGAKDYRMPVVRIPERYYNDYFGYLKDEAEKGLNERYPEGHPERKQAEENLAFELGIIKQMGFAEYFLDTRKTIFWAREHGILVGPGRGSGAGSTLNYCLKITDLDPIRYGLLFERFLNPERVSMPDIDVDYQDDRKSDVIASEAESNGKQNFCKIQTLGGLKAKMVIRDTCRVAGLSVAEASAITKLIPNGSEVTLKKAWDENPELRNLIEGNDSYKEVWDIALKLEGLKKSAGTHACGHIPTPVPCEELFPCSIDKETGYLVCQYDMAEAEHLGNLKKDLLMLRNLTIITNTQKTVKERYGKDLPLWTEDILNDKAALQLFWKGDTDGVFQFESEGMKKFMAELRPTCFEDIIAGVSLYRPGPMDYIPDYIKGKHDPESITYDVPELEEILAPTYGVITYQEQVMQIVQKLAGFSKGEADVVRKGMGKKKMDIIEKEGKKFIDGDDRFPGCVKNGYNKEVVEALWAKMAKFGQYAFNKSHAACYAAISMQTAYLKAHYPTEFYAGLLTSMMGDTKKLSKYIRCAEAAGLKIQKPDLNTSNASFLSGNGTIIFGLTSLKGVGENVTKAIVEEREKNGRYTSITELMMRVPSTDKKVITTLIGSGALDCLGHTRKSMLEALPQILKKVQSLRKKETPSEDGQISLFELFGQSAEPNGESDRYADNIQELPEMPKNELLAEEKKATGRYLSGHPFDEYAGKIAVKGFTELTPLELFEVSDDEEGDSEDNSTDMQEENSENDADATFQPDQVVAVAGMISDAKVFTTKKTGEPMKVIHIEDAFGSCKVVVFPKAYAQYSKALEEGMPVAVKGKIMVDDLDGSYSVSATSVTDLSLTRKFLQAVIPTEDFAGIAEAVKDPAGNDICRFTDGARRGDVKVSYGEKFRETMEKAGIQYKLMNYLVS